MEESLPLVSIVIPCRNYAHYVEHTIYSALNQTYPNIEVIAIDDASTDNSLEVMQSKAIKVLEHPFNQGLPFARNTGIREAKGELIIPLDADDQIVTEYVSICVSGYLSNQVENIGIVRTGMVQFTDDGRSSECPPLPLERLGDELVANRIFVSSMFPKKAWEEVGGYSEDMNDGFEDWEFWIKILEKGYNVLTVNKNILMYRIHSGSKGRARSFERTMTSKKRMYYKHIDTWKKCFVDDLPIWKESE